jgi:two-component system LytT family sensor kinase
LKTFQNSWFWLLPTLCFAAGTALCWLLCHYTAMPYELAWKEATISVLQMTAAIWIATLSVKAYPTRVGLLVYAICIGLLAGAITWHANYQLLKWLLGRFHPDYMNWLIASRPWRFLIFLLLGGWITSISAMMKRMRTVEEQFQQQSDASSMLREAELFKLRQQLQPHFLYNSLNSISALIMIMPEKAQEMIGRLSDFLRNSVKREAREQVPIDEELVYIEAYLAIEAVRFGDRLQVHYEKENTDGATIPPFLLQPILENAIKFGLYGKTGEVSIKMHIAIQQGHLILTVTNPYDPGNRPPSGTGFGLEGIQRRLYLLFARTDLLETRQDNDSFTTILKIPQSHV